MLSSPNLEGIALAQFNNASRLMPCPINQLLCLIIKGYGLPIGGVLALNNTISQPHISRYRLPNENLDLSLPYKGERQVAS